MYVSELRNKAAYYSSMQMIMRKSKLINGLDLVQVIVGLVLMVAACWSYGNLQVMGASHEMPSGDVYKHKRLALVQRGAASAGALMAVLSSGGTTQAERHSAMQEMAEREMGRIQFLEAKLGWQHTADAAHAAESGLRSPLYSGAIVNTANYVMPIGLGTPTSELLMVVDTGSDLAWTQCLPCVACFDQRDPFFDPTSSSSYKKVPCSSKQCAALASSSIGKCSKGATCQYFIGYLDGSFTTGDYATEAMSVSGEVVAREYPIGCGHENQGLFGGFDGLLGLSKSALSFPFQTKATFGGVFGYCMPPIFSTRAGYIEFGRSGREAAGMAEVAGTVAAPTGAAEATTPLLALSSSLYVVSLLNILVNGKPCTGSNGKALVVVDSGTVITRLNRPLYTSLKTAFSKAVLARNGVKQAPDTAGLGIFDACFTAAAAADPANLFPAVTFTFAGGAAFTITDQNLVIPTDKSGTYCLALLPLDSTAGVSILGNYQQQSHLFTFDIARSTLSISSSAC